jgi:hypothetical protein
MKGQQQQRKNMLLPPKPNNNQTWAQKLLSSGGNLQGPLRTIATNVASSPMNLSASGMLANGSSTSKYVPPHLIGSRSGSQGGYESSLKRRMQMMANQEIDDKNRPNTM